MARRQLPHRSTRGQLPPHLKIQPSPVKVVKVRKEDQQDIKRKEIEIRCKLTQINNLKTYPYSRAYHYFIDLESLPRAIGTISYALDIANTLNNTFSKDSGLLLQTPRKNILNRELIGLPLNSTGELPVRKENRCKNVCYLYLQEIQDKKYNSDRVIYTLKIILKKINRIQNQQLQKYQFIKKDLDLQVLLQQSLSLQQKCGIIQQKIRTLQMRKEVNCQNWKFQDQIYFYHALNQKLHNTVNEMKYKLTEQYYIKLLYEKEYIQYEYYPKKEYIKEFLNKVLHYYNQNILALSSHHIHRLIERAGINLIDLGPGQKFHVNYPIAILHFGRGEGLHTLTEFLVGRRAFNMGQTHFYQIKQMIKKLFDRNLKVKSERMITYDQYFKNFRKRYEQIRKNPKKKLKEQMQTHFFYPFLDECINTNVIHGKNEKILKLSNQIQITKKQYIFLMLYYWLSQCIAVLYPYLIQYHDLLEIIGSDYFPKVCNSLVQAIGQPSVGLFFYIFQTLTDLMSKSNQLNQVHIKLIYSYDAKLNIGIIWREEPDYPDQLHLKNSFIQSEFKALPLKKIKQT